MRLRCGKTSWAISVILRISERTVNFHVNNIMRKLGVIIRMQAVSVAFDNEWAMLNEEAALSWTL
jgi:LuxR family quorum-sensing transcriptional regulator LasR